MAAAAASEMLTGHGDAYYVYGIIPGGLDGWQVGGLVDQAPVQAVSVGEVSVLISDLSRAGILADDLKTALSKEKEHGPLMQAHHGVLQRLRRAIPDVLPVPAGKIYTDLSALRRQIKGLDGHLSEAFAHIGAAAEWIVCVEAPKDTQASSPEALSDLEKLRQESLIETFDWLHTELSRIARDCLRRRDGPVAQSAWPYCFESAYLVDNADEEGFRHELKRIEQGLAHYGWRIDVRGPDPACSFLHLGL